MKRPLSHYFEYVVMLTVQQLIRITPLWLLVLNTRILIFVILLFYKPRNQIVMGNLKQAFPDKSLKELKQIRNQSYFNILLSSFESYKYMYLSKEAKLKHLLIDEESKATLFRLHNAGKGCLTVGGHYGFFEAGGHYSVLFNIPSAFVVANQKNKLTEDLIDIPRRNIGLKVIHRKHARELIEAVREHYIIALLTDQDAGDKGVFVDFFGRMAATHKNPAVMALKYDMPLMFAAIARDKKRPTYHHIHFEEIDYSDIKNSDLEHDDKVLKIVQRYTDVLAASVKNEPEHYWWIHKRYKTQPK